MVEYVNCATRDCESTIEKSRVALDDAGKWVCQDCARKTPSIGIRILDFIKNRITVNQTEDEDRAKFVFRELVQNADDARANILVARFHCDALYIGNDGRAFTTAPGGDFDKMSQILGQWKRDEMETTGNFGSGFQTVYAITNTPEVHSNAHSRRTNPVKQKWEFAEDTYDFEDMESPYASGVEGHRGVLFRFVWRTDDEAQTVYEGFSGAPFEDESDWPRWPEEKRVELYKDLKKYIHDVILCCQSLRIIRLILVSDDGKIADAFQVERDFVLDKVSKNQTVTVLEGTGQPLKGFSTSFQNDSWSWTSKERFDYYLVSSRVHDKKGNPLHMYKTKSGSLMEIKISKSERDCNAPNCHELKKNELFILFPLFDFDSRFPDKPDERQRAYLYSVIPLPKRGPNKFVFSAHLFPAENRLDVDVDGNFGKNREWYEFAMESLTRLYVDSIPLVIKQIRASKGLDNSLKQKVVMNNLPGSGVHDWMRPSREIEEYWDEENEIVAEAILELEGVLFKDKWCPYNHSFLPATPLEHDIIEILGETPISEEITAHSNYGLFFKNLLEKRKFDFLYFWNKGLYDENELKYVEKSSGIGFTRGEILKLIDYCKGQRVEKPLIPGKDRILRRRTEYRRIPEELPESLVQVLPHNRLVHQDFSDIITDIEQASPIEIIEYINQSYENQGHPPIDDEYHKVLSQTLLYLIKSTFNMSKAASLNFIPFELGEDIYLGKPNSVTIPRREDYEREWIYGHQPTEVVGLSARVKSRIRFLKLAEDSVSEKDIEEVERHFGFFRLREGTKVPTLFVRNFVSSKHGSLFDERNLKEFLDDELDDATVTDEKKILQKVIPVYFKSGHSEAFLTPRDMGKVRCLYDENENWFEPNKFVIRGSMELESLGYKSLHSDLLNWGEATLQALGVEKEPQLAMIINKIHDIIDDEHISESERDTLLMDIILDFMIHNRDPGTLKDSVVSAVWIPTNQGLLKAREAIWPYAQNTEILGNDCPHFIKIESASPTLLTKFKDSSEETQLRMIGNLEKWGVPANPTKQQMVEAVRRHMEEEIPPPKDLFLQLGELVRENELIEDGLGYFHENEWYHSGQFVLRDFSKELPEELSFVICVTENEKYLKAIGVDKYVDVNAILVQMTKDVSIITDSLWIQLNTRRVEINSLVDSEYGDWKIYPLNGELVAPSDILIIKMQLTQPFFAKDGKVIVSEEHVKNHREILIDFNASDEDSLSSHRINEIIQSCFKTLRRRKFNEDTANLLMYLIRIAYTLESEIHNLMLPISQNDEDYRLFKADLCYFRDDYRHTIFKDKIPILVIPLSEDFRAYLRNYAVSSLRDAIRESDEHQGDFPEREYQDQTSRLQQIGTAMKKLYPDSDCAPIFGWLLSAQVYRVPVLTVEYSVNTKQGLVTAKGLKQAHLKISDDEIVNITLAYPATAAIYDELADTIISHSMAECNSEGLVFDFKNLQSNLVKMLQTNPVEWQFWISEFRASNLNIAPFEIIEEEDARYRKGYPETRETLKGWYGGCQICGMQTPMSESTDADVMETVSSIVSRVGGFAYGDPGSHYKPGNSLYLCPRHQKLLKRRLVRIPRIQRLFDFEPDAKKERKRIESLSSHFEKLFSLSRKDLSNLNCEVYESKDSNVFEYKPNRMKFRPKHFKEMLVWIQKYLEKRLQVEH